MSLDGISALLIRPCDLMPGEANVSKIQNDDGHMISSIRIPRTLTPLKKWRPVGDQAPVTERGTVIGGRVFRSRPHQTCVYDKPALEGLSQKCDQPRTPGQLAFALAMLPGLSCCQIARTSVEKFR